MNTIHAFSDRQPTESDYPIFAGDSHDNMADSPYRRCPIISWKYWKHAPRPEEPHKEDHTVAIKILQGEAEFLEDGATDYLDEDWPSLAITTLTRAKYFREAAQLLEGRQS